MMRSHGWDRDLPEKVQKELRSKYNVSEFDSLYTFYLPGFNLRSTDLQAFLGLRAVDKLDNVSTIRKNNFLIYHDLIKGNLLEIQNGENNFISNFAFPVVKKERESIIKSLTENGIEVRPLIAGDMSKKPMWIENFGQVFLPNCDLINKFGFYLPNHQDLTTEQITFISSLVNLWKI
jgi:CDP-6-deoxy-D-xylo-4-hexulose-3-dehydrase